jgi:phosphoribosylformylglycinamidine synthase subunit PurQ / glutaminase
MNVKALVLTGNGTNCEVETAHALKLAGVDEVQIKTIWELSAGKFSIDDFNFLILPGGFSDGDHLGSGKARAHRFNFSKPENQKPLIKQIKSLLEKGGIIMGICNGFQVLVKLGLLPFSEFKQTVTLTHNLNGRFENRWVTLICDPKSPCVFTKGVETIQLPVRHGEGRIVFDNINTRNSVINSHLVPFQYCDSETFLPTEDYPANPNGSIMGIAGLCDSSGRIFGLMPHPEAFTHKTNHPKWTRLKLDAIITGVKLFENGVNYLKAGIS